MSTEKAGLRMDGLEGLEAAVEACVPEGEYLVHYELIIQTRTGNGAEEIVTRRICTPGGDPYLSFGLLTMQAALLSRRMTTGQQIER